MTAERFDTTVSTHRGEVATCPRSVMRNVIKVDACGRPAVAWVCRARTCPAGSDAMTEVAIPATEAELDREPQLGMQAMPTHIACSECPEVFSGRSRWSDYARHLRDEHPEPANAGGEEAPVAKEEIVCPVPNCTREARHRGHHNNQRASGEKAGSAETATSTEASVEPETTEAASAGPASPVRNLTLGVDTAKFDAALHGVHEALDRLVAVRLGVVSIGQVLGEVQAVRSFELKINGRHVASWEATE